MDNKGTQPPQQQPEAAVPAAKPVEQEAAHLGQPIGAAAGVVAIPLATPILGDDGKAPKDGDGCIGGAKRHPHIIGVVLTLGLVVELCGSLYCLFVGCGVTQSGFGRTTYKDTTGTAFAIALAVNYALYVLYVLASLCCGEAKFLRKQRRSSAAHTHVRHVRLAPPTLAWHIECYHYETRTRTETSTDADGNQTTTTVTDTVRVTTHTASTTYDYGSWQDASENYLPVTNYKLTKLYMKKRWTFDNAVTKAHHDARKAAWVAFHDRDVHKSVSETLKIPGYESALLCAVHPGVVPACLGIGPYLAISLCCLGAVPYLWWFSSITGDVKYTFVKQISIVPKRAVAIVPDTRSGATGIGAGAGAGAGAGGAAAAVHERPSVQCPNCKNALVPPEGDDLIYACPSCPATLHETKPGVVELLAVTAAGPVHGGDDDVTETTDGKNPAPSAPSKPSKARHKKGQDSYTEPLLSQV